MVPPLEGPTVSVIIPAFEASATLPLCLDALAEQEYAVAEIIVVDGSPDPWPVRRVCADRKGVQLRTADPALGAHAKRNIGAAEARGDVLVFTDPDCVPSPTWIERLVGAHANGHAIVGGSVAGLDDAKNRAIHVCKYAWWLPGGEGSYHSELPSANTSCTREAWQRFGPYRDDRWAGDSELSWRVRQSGVPLWFEPAAQTTHLDHGPWWSFLKNRYGRGLDFGLTRAESRVWGRLRRGLQSLAFPLVPLVMTARAAMFCRRAGQTTLWIRTVPAQLLAHGAWALGESCALFRSSTSAGRP